jgi:hypothetical protein
MGDAKAPPDEGVSMSMQVLIASMALGGAAISLWLAYRLPSLAPQSLRGIMMHVGGALAVCQLVSFGLGRTLDPADLPRTMTGLFGLALPALVYCFLVGFWAIRMTQDVFSRASH